MKRPFSDFRAIVFDLDDTIFPERDYVLGGLDAASRAAAGFAGDNDRDKDAMSGDAGTFASELSARARRLFESGERGSIFNQLLAGLPRVRWPEDAVPRMVRAYREHAPALTLAPEVTALLRLLRERGRKTGVITDGWLDVQRRKVAALGLAPLVDAIIYSDTWGRAAWKPSLRPFREMETALAAAPAECLYIGDNPAKDFLGARNASWASLRLRIPGREHSATDAPPPLAPDFLAESWASLAAMLAP